MKPFLIIVCCILTAVVVLLLFRRAPRETVQIEYRTDTVTVRDTVRVEVPRPYRVETVRTDTVFVRIPGDSGSDRDSLPVTLPIERKEYKTDDYRAVVEGWKPRLVEMEVYPQIRYITCTETQTVTRYSRWGFGVQAGYGITTDGRLRPYVGVGVQYTLWSW